MLWDLAGSEKFDTVRASYLRGAAGAVIVYDLTRPTSLDAMSCYADQLRQVNPRASLVLAGNKEDLTSKRQITDNQIAEQSAALRAPSYLTSAKNGANVDAVFRHLSQLLIA